MNERYTRWFCQLILVGLLLLVAQTAVAQGMRVRLGVSGMVWPTWAYGVQRALSRLDGVTDVSVSLRKAEADFTIKAGTRFDVDAIRRAIRDYGFTPTWLEFTVKAELTTHQGKPALRALDTGQFIRLVENPPLDALRKALIGRTAPAVITAVIPEGEGEIAAIKSFSLTDN